MIARRAAAACDPGHGRLINFLPRFGGAVRRIHVNEIVGENWEAEPIEPCATRRALWGGPKKF
jgi:hypothetical protein